MTTSNEITLILAQMETLLGQTTVLAAEVAKNYNNFTASPAFTGIPTAPTAPIGTNSNQLATTAYLDRLIGQANGLATLGSDGLIPTSQLPPLAITQIFVVNSQAAMLALDAQPGDIAIRTDTNQTYILTAEPASTLANWTLLLFAAPVTSVFGRTGTVVAASGDYTVAQVTGAAPLASPTFTGTPAAPTPGTNINTTQIPTTAWVNTWYAPLASPTFTGTPAAPTAAVNTNTTQIATTAFVVGQAGSATPLVDGTAAVGTSLLYARQDHVHPTDTSRAPLASPAFTGTPTAPTAAPGTNTTQVATTAFVTSAIGALTTGVSSVFGRSGAVTAQSGDYAVAQVTGAAPLASPTFTGTPAAPTPGSNISTTQIPTTAWVNTYFATLASPSFTGQVGFNGGTVTASTPIINGNQTWNNGVVAFTAALINITDTASAAASKLLDLQVGGVSKFSVAKDGSVPSLALTGVPTAPTAAPGTNTTQIASTAYVIAAISGAGAVASVFGRTGAVVATSGDYSVGQVTGAAPLASPTFTGTPAAPTAAVNTNTTQLATTAFVVGQAGTASPLMNNTVAVGTSLLYSRQDHVHPVDTSRAPLASPTFTGTPAAPTPGSNINTTQIPTTAWVNTWYAAKDSPAFTGTPTAPTASPLTNNTQIATTAYVDAAVSANGAFSTGDIKATLKTTADTGWVMCNDGTIGSASSGATTRANADTQALYTLLWNNVSNTYAPVTGGRGASASADFSANKPIALTKMLGRALASAGAGSGLTSRALGETQGLETVTLTSATQASMSVSASGTGGAAGNVANAQIDSAPNSPTGIIAATTGGSVSVSGTASGSGGAHQNMQPTSFVNFMIKL